MPPAAGRPPSSDAAQDAYAGSVDALVGALRTDPVNVQQTRGNGHTEAVDDALSAMVENSATPIYVALVGDLPDLEADRPADDLVSRMHARLGEDGFYVAAVGPHVEWSYFGGGDAGDVAEGRVSTAYRSLDDEQRWDLTKPGEVAMVTSVLAGTTGQADSDGLRAFVSDEPWREPDEVRTPSSTATVDGATFAAVVGTLVLLVCWRLGRSWATPRGVRATAARARPGAPGSDTRRTRRTRGSVETEAPRPTVVRPAELRAKAERTLDALTTALFTHPSAPRAEDATGCRVAAERLLDSTDPLDLVGALILSRIGRSALERPGDRYLPCFVNPLHARPEGRARMAVAGRPGEGVDVPLCPRCQRAEWGAGAPDPLLDGAGGAYYAGDTVWARTGYGALDDEPWRAVLEARS